MNKILLTAVTSVLLFTPFSAKTSEEIYLIERKSVVPGFTAKQVTLGYNIGKGIQLEFAKELPQSTGMASFMKNMITIQEKTQAAMHSDVKQTHLTLSTLTSGVAVTSKEPQVELRNGPLKVSNLTALKSCATQAKSALYLLLKAEQTKDHDRQALQNNFLLSLRENSQAWICAQHLGSVTLKRISTTEEIKWISAVSQANSAQLKQLMVATIATYALESPVLNQAFWVHLYQDLSFETVFRKSENQIESTQAGLVKRAQIFDQASQTLGPYHVQVTQNSEEILKKGLEFARTYE
jgi:hypothetical protein